MWPKYLIIVLLFLSLSLIQNSFLQYFSILGATPNLVFVLFFLFTFFGWQESFLIAVLAGFFTDLFLPSYFGIGLISILIIYLIINLAKYLFEEFSDKHLILYFIILFSAVFLAYNFLMYILSIIFELNLKMGTSVFISLIYNLLFAVLGFYIYRSFMGRANSRNQLKLFS